MRGCKSLFIFVLLFLTSASSGDNNDALASTNVEETDLGDLIPMPEDSYDYEEDEEVVGNNSVMSAEENSSRIGTSQACFSFPCAHNVFAVSNSNEVMMTIIIIIRAWKIRPKFVNVSANLSRWRVQLVPVVIALTCEEATILGHHQHCSSVGWQQSEAPPQQAVAQC